MGHRADALAARVEEGAAALEAFARGLSDAEWRTTVSARDPRPVGVVVHHVGEMYPIEIEVARTVASGKPVAGVTWEAVGELNAKHTTDHAHVTKEEALAHLRSRSKAAAEAVRQFTDAELDTAAPFSLSFDAPMTAQFVIEDHALRHAWHHLARIRAAVGR
ncbi:MAG TPA: DinB family protein [Gemmatimonadales bacterium]|nr:DinB family protein [Gemmatimonadales bacterium]